MIGERFNFEDVFFRDLTVCVLDTLEGQVKWLNRFSSGDVFVQVPFYYSLTGDERFLLDSFADDIVSENRFVELNHFFNVICGPSVYVCAYGLLCIRINTEITAQILTKFVSVGICHDEHKLNIVIKTSPSIRGTFYTNRYFKGVLVIYCMLTNIMFTESV